MEEVPYIKRISIDGLCGVERFNWELVRGVNVLSGINGSGKSTILQSVMSLLKAGVIMSENTPKPIRNIEIEFENGNLLSSKSSEGRGKKIPIDIVSTFDSSLKIMEALQKLTDNRVRTDLDWELYLAHEKYLRYQLTLGKKAIEILISDGDKSELKSLMIMRDKFYNIVDALFKESGKKIDRESDALSFIMRDIKISPYQLSSGEKQIITILMTVVAQNSAPYILIMDEPEISLHFEWQKKLVHYIMELNPALQLIITTHSPAVVMEGWLDRVKDVSELITYDNTEATV